MLFLVRSVLASEEWLLCQVERVRLFVRLRHRLKKKAGQKEEKGAATTPVSPSEPKCPIPAVVKLQDKEKGIANKVSIAQLCSSRRPMAKDDL